MKIDSMRICIAGAGALGGYMGGMLAASGNEVTFVTLGDDLAAITTHGLKICHLDGTTRSFTDLRATDDLRTVGPHDLVILAVKANQIETISRDLPATYGPETVVLTVQNGIPWWYFKRCGGTFGERSLACEDPTGFIDRNIPADRIVGCVAYPAVERLAPGVLRNMEGTRFPVGELDGSDTERVRRIAETFSRAGFKAPVLADIRGEIWLKALGALAFNPISALTRATLVDICRCPETRALATRMMQEAEEIARRLGVTLRLPIERRIAGAEAVGAHKTSMLQDVENGRPLEIDALLLSVIELGRLTGSPVSNLEAVYACTRLLDRTLTTTATRLRHEGAPSAATLA
jgi:2-dehydropantoate 2-reductase